MDFELLILRSRDLRKPPPGKLTERIWGAYRRALDLPILAAVWLDALGLVALSLRLTEMPGWPALAAGLALLPVGPWFAVASTYTWRRRLEDDDVEAWLAARRAARDPAVLPPSRAPHPSPADPAPETARHPFPQPHRGRGGAPSCSSRPHFVIFSTFAWRKKVREEAETSPVRSSRAPSLDVC